MRVVERREGGAKGWWCNDARQGGVCGGRRRGSDGRGNLKPDQLIGRNEKK